MLWPGSEVQRSWHSRPCCLQVPASEWCFWAHFSRCTNEEITATPRGSPHLQVRPIEKSSITNPKLEPSSRCAVDLSSLVQGINTVTTWGADGSRRNRQLLPSRGALMYEFERTAMCQQGACTLVPLHRPMRMISITSNSVLPFSLCKLPTLLPTCIPLQRRKRRQGPSVFHVALFTDANSREAAADFRRLPPSICSSCRQELGRDVLSTSLPPHSHFPGMDLGKAVAGTGELRR